MDDAGIFFWARSNKSNKRHKNNGKNTTNKFLKLFIIWNCTSFKGQRKMAIITSTLNTHEYIKILDYFLISLIENWSDDDKFIFLDGNASCQGCKGIKAFILERYMLIMT